MSEIEPKQKKVKEPVVTESKLAEVLTAISQNFDATVKELKESNENMGSELRKNTAEFSRILNEHAEAINALAKGGAAVQPSATGAAVPTTNKLDDIIQKITAITDLPIVKQKLGLEQDPIAGEFSNLAEVVAMGAKREVAAAMKSSIRKYLKQGHLYGNEVKDVLLEETGKHGI